MAESGHKEKRAPATPYSDEVAAEICERLAAGESLRSVCRDPEMPCTSAVMRWVSEKLEFQKQYTLARELQADIHFDGMLELADAPCADQVDAQHRRVQIDTRKWVLARMSPRKYGDRKALEHSGPDGAPIPVDDVSKLTPEEARRRYLEFIRA